MLLKRVSNIETPSDHSIDDGPNLKKLITVSILFNLTFHMQIFDVHSIKHDKSTVIL